MVIENRTTELGRFTHSAAHMLKAKVLVYWASPLFNGNTDYNSFLNHEGEPFFNQTYNAQRWADAAEACKEAIDVCTKQGFACIKLRFCSHKTQSDTTLLVNVTKCREERWNKEIVWDSSYPVNWGYRVHAFQGLNKEPPLLRAG